MKSEVTGIIIREKDLSDSDKVISILTCEKGIVSVIAKRSKTIKNRLGGMIQLFAYGTFTLFSAKNGYLLDGFQTKELFLPLRSDLEALSLGQYFCQLSLVLRPEREVSGEFLRVFLNCLFYLAKGKMEANLIKSIFEFRACSLCGYMPRLVSCDKCGKYDDDLMFFEFEIGKIFCKECASKASVALEITPSVLTSLRHIVYSPIEKLFSFSVSSETAETLAVATEKYVTAHVAGNFKSLEFYKKMANFKI